MQRKKRQRLPGVRFIVGDAHATYVAAILMTVLLLAAAVSRGSETFRHSFAGEKTGEPMLALSSPDGAAVSWFVKERRCVI